MKKILLLIILLTTQFCYSFPILSQSKQLNNKDSIIFEINTIELSEDFIIIENVNGVKIFKKIDKDCEDLSKNNSYICTEYNNRIYRIFVNINPNVYDEICTYHCTIVEVEDMDSGETVKYFCNFSKIPNNLFKK